MTNILRQGDITFTPVVEDATGVQSSRARVQAENGRLVIALGEQTGHSHSFEETEGLTVYQARENDRGITHFVHVEGEPVVLEHPEHGPLVFEPGIYAAGRQREFDDTEVRRSRQVYD